MGLHVAVVVLVPDNANIHCLASLAKVRVGVVLVLGNGILLVGSNHSVVVKMVQRPPVMQLESEEKKVNILTKTQHPKGR